MNFSCYYWNPATFPFLSQTRKQKKNEKKNEV